MNAEFCRRFFLHLLSDHMAFIFQFVDMVYHFVKFVYNEESLHPWDELELIMIYDIYNVLLDSVC